MNYVLEHIYIYSFGESVRLPICISSDLKDLEQKAIEYNEHEIKFHGDSKDVSFYRVRWVKENK